MSKQGIKKTISVIIFCNLLIGIMFIIYCTITVNNNANTGNFYIISVLKNDTNEIQHNNDGSVLSPNEIHINFNNGSYAILEPEKNEYLFQEVNLNDWGIETNNFKDIINIMATYTNKSYEEILKEINIPDYNLINHDIIKDQLIKSL